MKIARTPTSAPLNYPRRCVTLFYSFSRRAPGYFAAAPGSTTFYASGNVLTTEAGRATYDEYDLGTTVGSWFTLEMFQWFVYNKAVECYALGRPLPSIDAISWEGVFTTPCADFPVVAGLP